MTLLKALAATPKYTLVRGAARFGLVRSGVTSLKGLLSRSARAQRESELVERMPTTLFPEIDGPAFLQELERRGCAFGLRLPATIVEQVRAYAESSPVFADRDERRGFLPRDRARAEAVLGKQILLAQYYNVERHCPAVARLAADPLLNWIALKYLSSIPRYLGCNLWWTYPIRPNREDQIKHAHFFHRDIDDFKFLKFFFYLTDVEAGDGGHWLVSGSHKRPPYVALKDRVVLRRFEDREIESHYPRGDILEIVGRSGLGFAEDTLCVHKAASPSRMPRLMLQLQFALFHLRTESDVRDSAQLHMLPADETADVLR